MKNKMNIKHGAIFITVFQTLICLDTHMFFSWQWNLPKPVLTCLAFVHLFANILYHHNL